MIVDVHYHPARVPPDENLARTMVKMISVDFTRLGVSRLPDETFEVWREYMNDPDGNKLVHRMDESGIDVTVLLIVDNMPQVPDEATALRRNETCAQTASMHQDRLIAFASIDPRRPNAPELFRKCIKEFNMKGLKWHPDFGFYPNSEEAYKVLKVANELGVPLLTHCSPLSWSRAKYSHPIHLDDIALDFPNLNIIAAHSGLMWWHDWAALAQVKQNITGDLAMWQMIAQSNSSLFRRHLREILDIVGPGQILFASDGPYTESHVSIKRWVEIIKGLAADCTDGIKFSSKEVEAILGGNAARVLKLRN